MNTNASIHGSHHELSATDEAVVQAALHRYTSAGVSCAHTAACLSELLAPAANGRRVRAPMLD